MKWYFAVNELTLNHFDHDFPGLMLSAVMSARMNTSLEPHLIYDGEPNETTAALQQLGVTIVPHRITYYDQLAPAQLTGYNMLIAAGAFLRSEIPRLEKTDEFILYTDCDVIFRRDPSFLSFRPEYFACAPERQQGNYDDLNTGVMIMNVPRLRETLGDFLHYIVTRFQSFVAYDQDAYKQYYHGRYQLLAAEANWKPYWGWSESAQLVHFHGPKPAAIRKIIDDPAYPMPEHWRTLFALDPTAYRRYLVEWEQFRDAASRELRVLIPSR